MDLSLCMILASIVLPVMAAVALAFRLDYDGLIFFKQDRVG